MATAHSTKWTQRDVDALTNTTDNVIRRFDPDTDPDLKGFGVAISPADAKSYILSFTSPVDGKRKFARLESFDNITLKQARLKARRTREDIDEGNDPVLELKAQREAEKKAQRQAKIRSKLVKGNVQPDTFDELWGLYIASLEKRGAPGAKDYQIVYRLYIGPGIGSLRPADVSFDDCLDVISTISDRGAYTLAINAKRMMSGAFAWALNAKLDAALRNIVPDYGLRHNPARDISTKSIADLREARKNKVLSEGGVPAGERYLREAELKDLWARIDPSDGYRDMEAANAIAVMLLLSTGQRVEEVLSAPWSEFDLDDKTWAISARRRKQRQKLKADHIVPMCDLHVTLLNTLRPITGRSQWLFPNSKDTAPRSHQVFNQAVQRLCKAKGKPFQHFSPRDLRRTFKTLAGAEKVGISAIDRDRIQGHGEGGIRKAYDKGNYLPQKRAAMEVWCQYLVELTAAKDNVVRLVT